MTIKKFCGFVLVRMKGLEPPRLTAPDPKSGAATNYATSAKSSAKILFFLNFANPHCEKVTSQRVNILEKKPITGVMNNFLKFKIRSEENFTGIPFASNYNPGNGSR